MGGSNVQIYWQLADENEKFSIQREVSKMILESNKIDKNICSKENLKKIMNKKQKKLIKEEKSSNQGNSNTKNSAETNQNGNTVNYCVSNVNIENLNININNKDGNIY